MTQGKTLKELQENLVERTPGPAGFGIKEGFFL
jgi:hypothetical protein